MTSREPRRPALDWGLTALLPAPLVKAVAFLVSVLVSLIPGFGPADLPGADQDALNDSGYFESANPKDSGFEVDLPAAPPAPPPRASPTTPAPDVAPADEEPSDSPPKPFVKPKAPPPPFSARFERALVETRAGGTVPFTLIVRNDHEWHLSIVVELKDVTKAWRANARTERIELEPGEVEEVPAYLEAPDDARPGESGRMRIELTTPFPHTVVSVVATATIPVPEARRDVSIHNGDGNRYVAPGGTVNYTMVVTNLGDASDVILLGIDDGPAAWSATLTASSVKLAAGEVANVVLAVTAPASAQDDDAAFFNVTATSTFDPRVGSRGTTITVVDAQSSGEALPLDVVCVRLLESAPEVESQVPADDRVCVDLRPIANAVPWDAADDVPQT